MKKRLINIGLSILLSLTIIFVLISFTLLNKNFIKHYFDKNNYYETLYKETDKSMSLNEYKKELNKYIKSRYTYKMEDNSFCKYMNKYDVELYSYLIYIVTFIFIFITGNLFTNTKKKHDLYKIILISSIELIICYGLGYILISPNNEIVNNLVHISEHYILGFSIIMLEISIYKLYVKRLFKKCK